MSDIMREWNEALTAPKCEHGHLAPVCDLCKKAAEIAALREDAERYRWLRDKARSVDWTESINGWSWTQHCRIGARGMDAAIDAARKGTT